MNDIKVLLKQHLITVLCVISIVAVFLPFATITVSLGSHSQSNAVSGLRAVQEGIFGYLLFVGPAVLIAMNYVKQLDRFKSLLVIVVPVICIVVAIIVFFQAKAVGGGSGGGDFDLDISAAPNIGFILAIISYIATAIAGAVTYHNLDLSNITLDKAGLERLKQEGKQVVSSVQDSFNQATQGGAPFASSAPAQNPAAPSAAGQPANATVPAPASAPAPVQPAPKAPQKKPVDLQRTEEILAMIERLSQMKEAGVLTDEEFSEKKRQLLAEIQM